MRQDLICVQALPPPHYVAQAGLECPAILLSARIRGMNHYIVYSLDVN